MAEYPPFIFQDAIPAQQMMAHAQAINEGRRIQELGKARQAEGLFRIAQLQQQAKQSQETLELNKLIAQSRMEQDKVANSLKSKELDLTGKLTREGYASQEKRTEQMYPAGKLDPRTAIDEARRKHDMDLEKQEADKDNALMQEWQALQQDIAKLTSKKKTDPRIPNEFGFNWRTAATVLNPFASLLLPKAKDQKAISEIDLDISRKMAKQKEIEGLLAARGKVPSMPRVGAPVEPGVALRQGQIQDTDVDQIKREAAAAIQAGANPAAVFQEMADKYGVDLR